MSVTKFVRAQDILKEKGFKTPPFDTAAFQNAVVEFFRENDVSARLTIISVRFVDYEDTPEGGLSISTEKVRDGYSAYYQLPLPISIYYKDWEEDHVNFPSIVIDEPYVTNAIGLLKMLGFIVSRKHKWRHYSAYTVTLV